MAAVSSRARQRDMNRGFVYLVLVSLLLHAAAIGARFWLEYLRPPQRVFFDAVPVQLVKLGKPRDPNLLPRLTSPPPAPPPDDGISLGGKDPSKRTDPKSPSKEPKMSDAARRLLESARDDATHHPDEDEGAEDGSIYGTTTDRTNAASGYIAKVSEALHASYKLPATIPESERRFLSAEVVLYIERDGTISKYEFLKSHPNAAFTGALESVLKTLRLPPPPPELAATFREAGLGVRFKPM
jgi:outer membrane biosynthesis protein TonB